MKRAWAFLPYLVVGALLALSVPPWPDDWDGIGFVESIRHFDLARFSPHPPGYPVYVALLRVASWLTPTPLFAANAVAVASGVVALAALASAARTRCSAPHVSRSVLLVTAVTPLVWRSLSAVGSEAPALACVSLALWGLSFRDGAGAWIAGAFVGLGLGVRASWLPLFIPMLVLAPAGHRARAVGAACVATLAWAVPFVWIVGPAHLATLLRTHLLGHASRWGGTAITEPVRVRYLARDLFVDGFGVGGDALGIAILSVGVIACAFALVAWHRRSWRGSLAATLVLAPYVVWIAVGQNLRQQPRHVLPVVVAIAVGLGLAFALDRRSRVPIALLFALATLRSVTDAYERRTIPPVGAQLVTLVRGLSDRSRVMIFGGPSVRFFEDTELASRAVSVGSLGEVFLALGSVDRLPFRVFVTSEVERVDEPGCRFDPWAVLSRPPRIDRRAPTLEVFEMHASFLPRE